MNSDEFRHTSVVVVFNCKIIFLMFVIVNFTFILLFVFVINLQFNYDHEISIPNATYFKTNHLNQVPGVKNYHKLPWIFVITPTKYKLTQKADLTRLIQTLKWVPKLHFILVEDNIEKDEKLEEMLKRSQLNYSHLAILDDGEAFGKGMCQRNQGLEWLRTKYRNLVDVQGVVYFADDDNTYDIRLFSFIRRVKRIGVWPVGLVGGSKIEMPRVYKGRVVGWTVEFARDRQFATDMAGFAINLPLILNSNVTFGECGSGYQETCFLQQFGFTLSDLEPFGFDIDNKKEVFVWHTRTLHNGKHGDKQGFEIK